MNSIVEAMANGKPIIASAVGGILDMIDRESGILVPPGDARALAKAMIVLAEIRNFAGRWVRPRSSDIEHCFHPTQSSR